MKGIIALFLFFAVSTAYESFSFGALGNSLDEIMEEALEYVRFLLKRHDPYNLPALADQHLTDSNVDIIFSTDSVQWSKAGDFTIDKMSNNLPLLKASFQISSPTEYIQGNYKIKGTAFQKTVQGSGVFKVAVNKFVQFGDVQYDIVDHSLQVKNFKIDFSIGDLKADVEGMSIEGKTEQEVKDFFSSQLLNYLNNNKATVCANVADHVKAIANKTMKGKDLKQVLDWLRMLVASTPDPPPFTV